MYFYFEQSYVKFILYFVIESSFIDWNLKQSFENPLCIVMI